MDNTRYPDETDRKYQGLKSYYEKVRTEQKYLQLQLHQMAHNCVWMWRVILKTLWKSLPQNVKIGDAEYQSERITIHVALSGVLLRWFYVRCSWYVVTVFLGRRRAHRSWGQRKSPTDQTDPTEDQPTATSFQLEINIFEFISIISLTEFRWDCITGSV